VAILTFEKAYAAARSVTSHARSAKMILEAGVESFSERIGYDIFLSHSIRDADAVIGVKALFERKRLKVYVDWIDDRQLDRSMVNKSTAIKIRERMTTCKNLIYLCSENSTNSKWTPWELGFMDGKTSKAFILPISRVEANTFSGIEYLSIYPYIEFIGDEIYINDGGRKTLFVG